MMGESEVAIYAPPNYTATNKKQLEQKLIERLRKLYASQGIEVPDNILAEGVKALEEDRFTYKPPAEGIQTSLARIYIERGKWSRRLGAAALAALRTGNTEAASSLNTASLPQERKSHHGRHKEPVELPAAEQLLGQIQQSLHEHKRTHEKHLSRLAELEQVRRNFKSRRFDDIHSGFGNGATLTLMLNQFLQGLANSGDLWNTVRREQQYRPTSSNSPFGNRGVGRRTSTRRFPGVPGGGGPWGGGGGGFRTGGGF